MLPQAFYDELVAEFPLLRRAIEAALFEVVDPVKCDFLFEAVNLLEVGQQPHLADAVDDLLALDWGRLTSEARAAAVADVVAARAPAAAADEAAAPAATAPAAARDDEAHAVAARAPAAAADEAAAPAATAPAAARDDDAVGSAFTPVVAASTSASAASGVPRGFQMHPEGQLARGSHAEETVSDSLLALSPQSAPHNTISSSKASSTASGASFASARGGDSAGEDIALGLTAGLARNNPYDDYTDTQWVGENADDQEWHQHVVPYVKKFVEGMVDNPGRGGPPSMGDCYTKVTRRTCVWQYFQDDFDEFKHFVLEVADVELVDGVLQRKTPAGAGPSRRPRSEMGEEKGADAPAAAARAEPSRKKRRTGRAVPSDDEREAVAAGGEAMDEDAMEEEEEPEEEEAPGAAGVEEMDDGSAAAPVAVVPGAAAPGAAGMQEMDDGSAAALAAAAPGAAAPGAADLVAPPSWTLGSEPYEDRRTGACDARALVALGVYDDDAEAVEHLDDVMIEVEVERGIGVHRALPPPHPCHSLCAGRLLCNGQLTLQPQVAKSTPAQDYLVSTGTSRS